jgi:2-iminobutanoate/2-iminopropanoate deaminase
MTGPQSFSTGVAHQIGRYAELTDIVAVRQWLTSADLIPAYAAVRKEVIKHEPVFMLGVIPGLVWPKLRVEIEVTAVVRPTG